MPPALGRDAFHCPYCHVYADQQWYATVFAQGSQRYSTTTTLEDFQVSKCAHCQQHSLWQEQSLVVPLSNSAPAASEDMPEDVLADYREAADVFARSPRASAALLRLAVQKMCVALGKSGKNINDDIAALVRDGLPARIQKALDVVRVIGNNAVHPGEISIEDKPETAQALFGLLNLITDAMITQPRQIDELYGALPKGAREQIDKRDGR